MNEAKHFLEAISKGEPNADLIYADWLEEQGKPEADEIRADPIIILKEWSRARSRSRMHRFIYRSLSICSSVSSDRYFSVSHSFRISSCRSGSRSHSYVITRSICLSPRNMPIVASL